MEFYRIAKSEKGEVRPLLAAPLRSILKVKESYKEEASSKQAKTEFAAQKYLKTRVNITKEKWRASEHARICLCSRVTSQCRADHVTPA